MTPERRAQRLQDRLNRAGLGSRFTVQLAPVVVIRGTKCRSLKVERAVRELAYRAACERIPCDCYIDGDEDPDGRRVGHPENCPRHRTVMTLAANPFMNWPEAGTRKRIAEIAAKLASIWMAKLRRS